jgi:LysM repeat protein
MYDAFMRRNRLFILILAWICLVPATGLNAQTTTDSLYWSYIRKYSSLAVNEMYYSKIPASITMAQALLESRFGTSELAVNANNHFGIKCQTGWSGEIYHYQDDDDNTCFRKYGSIEESFRDHSHFLMYRPRYQELFKLDPTDYTSWAHGLKQAGYATNPNYGPMLLRIIEDYKLYLLDSMQPEVEAVTTEQAHQIPNHVKSAMPPVPKVFHRNRIDFTIVSDSDNIASLTKKFQKLNWEIRKYNEIPKDQDVRSGQVVYLQPKRTQAEAGYTTHIVEPGESMYSISQTYGIKLRWLYKRNAMKMGTEPNVGDEIWLRGQKSTRR